VKVASGAPLPWTYPLELASFAFGNGGATSGGLDSFSFFMRIFLKFNCKYSIKFNNIFENATPHHLFFS
jgi:hypothetical protein